jgi:hypothetical protein
MAKDELITAARLRGRLHYEPETGVFTNRVNRSSKARAGEVAGTPCGGYRHIKIGGGQHLAHRLAWLYMIGEWPTHEIDHINGDRADNRWRNLREAGNSKNQANSFRRPSNMSGFKGVSWDNQRRKWRAGIKVRGRSINLGCFDSPERAFIAYAFAAWKHFGEFARVDAAYLSAMRHNQSSRIKRATGEAA